MTDLHERLGRLAGNDTLTTTAQADADLVRARSAVRRRRTWRTGGAAVFVAAALVAGISYGTGGTSAGQQHLVAYQGQQPQGFTIDKVPAGWEIQGGRLGSLTIAPADAKDKNPDSFVGKIAITLQSQDDHTTPTGTKLSVNGRPSVLSQGEADVEDLWVQQTDGAWMQVQIWDGRSWSQDDLVEFAGGIHVQPGAVRGRG
jgi:hypothetical protein